MPKKHPHALNTEAAEQLLDVVRTYLKCRTVMIENSGRSSAAAFHSHVFLGEGAAKKRTQDMGGHLALRGHDGRGDCRMA